MNKELEALRKKILKNCRCDIKCLEYDNLLKALTPPTEDEVCEALSEYSNKKVYYENGKFEVGKYEPSICYLQEDNIVWFNWFKLPPHIITMIGRFYEGKKNE